MHRYTNKCMTSCPALDCVLLSKELHVRATWKSDDIFWSEAIRIDFPAIFLFLYELKVYFNGAFHNIWQFKPVNICTVEVGDKPGVPWRDNSSAYREKQAVRWTAVGTEGIYTTQ